MSLFTNRLDRVLQGLPNRSNVAIWGKGQIGDIFEKHLSDTWPNLSIIGFIESSVQTSVTKSVSGVSIYPSGLAKNLMIDLIVVASIKFEQEICDSIAQIDWAKSPQVFHLSKFNEEVIQDAQQAAKKLDVISLESLIFCYPEIPDLWRIYNAVAKNIDPAILSCAEALEDK